jgi:hypothetical protein
MNIKMGFTNETARVELVGESTKGILVEVGNEQLYWGTRKFQYSVCCDNEPEILDQVYFVLTENLGPPRNQDKITTIQSKRITCTKP